MRQIFNHLLSRIVYLSSERLSLLSELKSIMQKWVEFGREENDRHTQRSFSIMEDLLKNKDSVKAIISALEESKPKILTAEQEHFVITARKMFRWGMSEYKIIIEYAIKIGFDKDVLDGLQSDSKLGE